MTTPSNAHSLSELMVALPGGEIELRDDRKKTKWRAEIAPFALSTYPVTQALYLAMTGESPSTFKGDDLPVESVSWLEAVAFCNLLSQANNLEVCYAFGDSSQDVSLIPEAKGYRLPTDAEWEYACRAGTRDVRHGPLDAIAWYVENSGERTHPVGQKEPNGWGLYDMLGNVWEWCWDLYDEEVYGSYRIFRGGGWCDKPRSCLASNRRRSHPTYAIDDIGFRVARSLDASAARSAESGST